MAVRSTLVPDTSENESLKDTSSKHRWVSSYSVAVATQLCLACYYLHS